MDYSEAYKYYTELDNFINNHYRLLDDMYLDSWEIHDGVVVFDCSYDTECDAGCGFHYTTVEVPLEEVVQAMKDFNNKKADL